MLKGHVPIISAGIIATVLCVTIVCIIFGSGHFVNVAKKQTTTKPVELSSELLECNYEIEDFNDIIVSITRVLEFYQLYSKDLVLDATVGSRILQGQLQLTLQSFSLPSKIRMQLEELLKNTTNISDHIVGQFVDDMKANDQTEDGSERLKQNLNWVEGGSIWEMPAAGDWKEKSELDKMRYKVEEDDETKFSEVDFSDRCIGAVFENCSVPEECFSLFLGKRTTEYMITHAILFLLFSKKRGCFQNQDYMDKITRIKNPNDIVSSFCGKIFGEARAIEKLQFPIEHRDLFSEQVLACSMMGFQQFLKRSWLRRILSWQSKGLVGCFETIKTNLSKTFDEIYGIKNKSNRVKRYDNVFSVGVQNCSSHFTGVSLASIGIHLRYLVESCGESFFQSLI